MFPLLDKLGILNPLHWHRASFWDAIIGGAVSLLGGELLADDYGAEGLNDASAAAAREATRLERDKYELIKEDYLYDRPYRQAVTDAAIRQIPRAEDEYLKDLAVRDFSRDQYMDATQDFSQARKDYLDAQQANLAFLKGNIPAQQESLNLQLSRLRDFSALEKERGQFEREMRDLTKSEIVGAGSEALQKEAAERAMGATAEAFDAQDQTRGRALRSYGIKPGDAAFSAGERGAGLARAGALAKSGTDARLSERDRGTALRLNYASRFGGSPNTAPNVPGIPSVPVVGPSGTPSYQTASFNPNPLAVQAPGSGSMLAAANTLGALGSDAAANARRDARDLGYLAGGVYQAISSRPSGGGSSNPYLDLSQPDYSAGYYRKGGMVRRLRYANGGKVEGPGGPTADAIPATIDGESGARLSDGEYVIKAESVKKYGPRLLREVNEGTAIIVPTMSPRRLGR